MSAARRTLPLLSLLSLPVLANAQDPKPVREPAPRGVNVRPPGPATVTAKVAGTRSFVITWDSVPGATGYDIGRLAPPNGWQRVGQRVGPRVLEIHDGAQDILVPHTYRVVAIVGNLASEPTLSEPVKGEPNDAGPGAWNSTLPRCDTTTGRMYTSCFLRMTWEGGTEFTKGLSVECPSGSQLVSGGFDNRLNGYQVVRSSPYIGSGVPRWIVEVERIQSASVPATARQEVVVTVMCRLDP